MRNIVSSSPGEKLTVVTSTVSTNLTEVEEVGSGALSFVEFGLICVGLISSVLEISN